MGARLVVGTQWGDEGKAKVIDYLSDGVDVIARYQGGANAGHTVEVDGETYIFHLIPSGILYPNTVCVLGNGVALDPWAFQEELDDLKERGIDPMDRLVISDACHVIMPLHRILDGLWENKKGDNKIGTTKRGIGICYADKMMRIGLRMGEMINEAKLKERLPQILEIKNRELKDLHGEPGIEFEPLFQELMAHGDKLKKAVRNTSVFLNNELKSGKTVLLEGAQGTALDIDFGTYPYVTSSNTTTGGAITGSGISFQHLERVTGICKAYVTRVGEGPFPSELFGEEGEKLRSLGKEYGATTGRPRRCGWFDSELVRHAARVNGLTDLALTKLDILSDYDEIHIGTGYELDGQAIEEFPSCRLEETKVTYETMPGWKEDISKARSLSDLPAKCRAYVDRLVELTGVPVSIISVGPGRKDTILL